MMRKELIGIFGFFIIFLLSSFVLSIDLEPIISENKTIPKYNYDLTPLVNLNGIVDYTQNISSDNELLILRSSISIKKNKINIPSEIYPELNQPATITFLNTGITNPILINNGKWEKDAQIINLGGTDWQTTVSHFSEWSLFNNTWNGTHYNTTIFFNKLEKQNKAYLSLFFDTNATNQTNEGYSDNSITPANGITYSETRGHDGRGGYVFDGVDDAINLGTTLSEGITRTNKTTVSAWINLTATGTYRAVMGTQGVEGFHWQIYGFNGSMQTYLVTPNISAPVNLYSVANFNNRVNMWQHIAFTYDASGANALKFYVNGTLDSTQTGTAIINSTKIMQIGQAYDAVRDWIGVIDDVQVFNYSMSANEVQELYNHSKAKFYNPSTSYTEILNASDYGITSPIVVVKNITFGGNCNFMNLSARSGNCSLINQNNFIPYPLNANCQAFFNNDTLGQCTQINITGDITLNETFSLANKTLGVSDSCTPPDINNNWKVYFDNNCILSTNTDLGTGKIIISGGTGSLTIDANISSRGSILTCTSYPCRFIINPLKKLMLTN